MHCRRVYITMRPNTCCVLINSSQTRKSTENNYRYNVLYFIVIETMTTTNVIVYGLVRQTAHNQEVNDFKIWRS
jgi:hypothetical protein